MIEKLRQKNPNLKIYSVFDEEFKPFGRIIGNFDPREFISAAEKIKNPDEGSLYDASLPEFEVLDSSDALKELYIGELSAQCGYCRGHSNYLNAAEWHASNEINIAVTPLVLILGKLYDMKDNKIDSSDMTVFFVPTGTTLEVYSTTLHFCPCEVETDGFKCVVVLPEGTNTPLDEEHDDKLLFRKNKWIVAHEKNSALIARGVVPGVSGENIRINY